jgi:hypothetical protein
MSEIKHPKAVAATVLVGVGAFLGWSIHKPAPAPKPPIPATVRYDALLAARVEEAMQNSHLLVGRFATSSVGGSLLAPGGQNIAQTDQLFDADNREDAAAAGAIDPDAPMNPELVANVACATPLENFGTGQAVLRGGARADYLAAEGAAPGTSEAAGNYIAAAKLCTSIASTALTGGNTLTVIIGPTVNP